MPTKVGECGGNSDAFVLRHRNPMAQDFVIVSRVVLVGYPHLSDGAKVTYWVIYSHDWYDASKGARKGYAFPTIRRLAQLRHATDRTIQRHLTELIKAGLLTRIIRHGKPSILYIEEPSKDETERCRQGQNERGDIYVGGGVTKMSPPKEKENKQTNTVNGIKKTSEEEKREPTRGWKPIKALLDPSKFRRNSPRGDWIAGEIVNLTGDTYSLGCYRLIAKRCPQDLVFQALSLLKEAKRDGTIHKSRGALFVGIVRRLCKERGLDDPIRRRKEVAALPDALKRRVAIQQEPTETARASPGYSARTNTANDSDYRDCATLDYSAI